MAESELNRQGVSLADGKDGIVIVNVLGDIPGGRTIDTTGVNDSVVCAGHVIVKKADGSYAALAVEGNAYKDGGKYKAVDSGDTVRGVLRATIGKADGRAAIMTMGQVKEAALPFPLTDEIKAALKHIDLV